MSTHQPVTVRSGVVWDVTPDGAVVCWLGGPEDHTVEATPVGVTPPLGSVVLLLATYDRFYCLGVDASRPVETPLPDIPRMSKDADNALSAGSDGGWHVDWPHLKPGAALDPPGNWMPVSGGVFTGPIWVPEATQPGQPVRLGEFQGFVQAYLPWTAMITAYSDGQGWVKVLIGDRPTNPYYLKHTDPPEWVLVTPHVNADPARTVGAGTTLTAALGGLPAPTADEVWVGGFKPENLVQFTIQIGWRIAPLYGWNHQPPTGGGAAITAPPAAASAHTTTSTTSGQTNRTWQGNGTQFWDQSKLYFGVYDLKFGHQTSAAAFSAADVAQFRALQAGNVTGCTLTLTWDHTFDNAGGWVRVRVSGALPGSYTAGASSNEYFDIRLPAKSGTAAFPVPVSVAKQFCAGGAAQGFLFEGVNNQQSGYGYLRPDSMVLAISTWS